MNGKRDVQEFLVKQMIDCKIKIMGKNRSNELLESLLGLTKEEGLKLCSENDYIVRVKREDSNHYSINLDYRFNRINLELDKGIITKCNIG